MSETEESEPFVTEYELPTIEESEYTIQITAERGSHSAELASAPDVGLLQLSTDEEADAFDAFVEENVRPKVDRQSLKTDDFVGWVALDEDFNPIAYGINDEVVRKNESPGPYYQFDGNALANGGCGRVFAEDPQEVFEMMFDKGVKGFELSFMSVENDATGARDEWEA